MTPLLAEQTMKTDRAWPCNACSKTQFPAFSNMHYMAMPGQSSLSARRAAESFIQNRISEAHQLAQNGNRSGALLALSEAMHTIQDSSSPMHVDRDGLPKVWHPEWPFGHSPNEYFGN